MPNDFTTNHDPFHSQPLFGSNVHGFTSGFDNGGNRSVAMHSGMNNSFVGPFVHSNGFGNDMGGIRGPCLNNPHAGHAGFPPLPLTPHRQVFMKKEDLPTPPKESFHDLL